MILNDFDTNNEEVNDLKIVSVKLKDNYVDLKLEDDDSEYKLLVTLDNYLNYKLKENGYLSYDSYNELKDAENLILAYKSAIRRLGIKDYSESKMREALNNKFHLPKKDLDNIISNLNEHDYLNDERYTKYRIEYLLHQASSKRVIYKKLKDEGIDEELINKYYPKDNSENQNIKLKANKYLKTVKNKALNAKKKAILVKLVNDGFDLSLAKETVEHLDFNEDKKSEEVLIKKEKVKAINKYSKKYEGYELKNKVYAYLMSKGFNSEDINSVLNMEG